MAKYLNLQIKKLVMMRTTVLKFAKELHFDENDFVRVLKEGGLNVEEE